MKVKAIVFLLVLWLPLLGAFSYWQYLNKKNNLQQEQVSFNSLENKSIKSLFQLPNNVILHLTGIDKNSFKKLSFNIEKLEVSEIYNLIEIELNGAQFSIVKVDENEFSADVWVLTGGEFAKTEQLALFYSNFSLLENTNNENNEILLSNFVNSLIKPEIWALNSASFAEITILQEFTQIVKNQKPSTVSPPPDLILEKIA